jgi:hypothetical protein
METLDRLEKAIDTLLEQNRHLKSENKLLQTDKVTWQKERLYMLEEIDRILNRLDDVPLEES